jgi:hypothetical protein
MTREAARLAGLWFFTFRHSFPLAYTLSEQEFQFGRLMKRIVSFHTLSAARVMCMCSDDVFPHKSVIMSCAMSRCSWRHKPATVPAQ